jgi:hypothetical protein
MHKIVEQKQVDNYQRFSFFLLKSLLILIRNELEVTCLKRYLISGRFFFSIILIPTLRMIIVSTTKGLIIYIESYTVFYRHLSTICFDIFSRDKIITSINILYENTFLFKEKQNICSD